MALVLDATLGATTTNTYNVVADLDSVSDELLPAPAAYLDADPDTINRAAVRALRLLDQERFPGARATITQVAEWPRSGVRKSDIGGSPGSLTGYYAYYLITELPWAIQRAHALLTFYLLDQNANGVDPFARSDTAGIKGLTLDTALQIQFEDGASYETLGEGYLQSVIRPLLAQYGLSYAAQVAIVRG